MRTIGRIQTQGKRLAPRTVAAMPEALAPMNSRVELIQALIALGLGAAAEALADVEEHPNSRRRWPADAPVGAAWLGRASASGDGPFHAVLWSQGVMTDFGTLDGFGQSGANP
jgi:hypothetical protein